MKKTNPPYVDPKISKGRRYNFFRKGGKYTRLPDDMDSQEFWEAYWALRSGRTQQVSKTTWSALIESYLKSPGYLSKSNGTRANYRRHCDAIREKNGQKDVRKFRRKDAIAARDALAETWSKANERLAVLSILCAHAVDLEWIDRNPVAGIGKLKGGEYEPWPAGKLRAFERAAGSGTLARTVYELAIGTGQRLGDCIAMRWEDFDGEYMAVVQEKTGTRLWVYCPQRLRDYLASLPRGGRHILAKNLVEPIGKRRVQAAVEAVREAIGAKDGPDRLVIHGWRYNAAVALADAGCSDLEIQAVTGHKSAEMVAKYRRRAGQREASKRAQQRREQNGNEGT